MGAGLGRATAAGSRGRSTPAASGLLSTGDDPALDRWTGMASTLLDAPVALLSLVDGGRLFFKSHVGLSAEMAARRETARSDSLCQHVIADQLALVVGDVRQHDGLRDRAAVEDLGIVAYAGEPVTTADGHALGCLCVIDHVPRAWTAAELALLGDLAAGLRAEIELRAALLTADELQAELTRRADVDPLTAQPAGSAQAVLLEVLREREPQLDRHVRQVAGLARRVCAVLGLGSSLSAEIAVSAEMHDIGKVAVPDCILDKPGPLDDDEWAIMREHTVVGQRILSAAPALAGVGVIVRSSHERWDGDGYPDGLAAGRIPLGAQIVAACDSFDAMTSERPYSPGRSGAEATAEIRRQSGHQFAPAVVRALLIVLRQTGRVAA